MAIKMVDKRGEKQGESDELYFFPVIFDSQRL